MTLHLTMGPLQWQVPFSLPHNNRLESHASSKGSREGLNANQRMIQKVSEWILFGLLQLGGLSGQAQVSADSGGGFLGNMLSISSDACLLRCVTCRCLSEALAFQESQNIKFSVRDICGKISEFLRHLVVNSPISHQDDSNEMNCHES